MNIHEAVLFIDLLLLPIVICGDTCTTSPYKNKSQDNENINIGLIRGSQTNSMGCNFDNICPISISNNIDIFLNTCDRIGTLKALRDFKICFNAPSGYILEIYSPTSNHFNNKFLIDTSLYKNPFCTGVFVEELPAKLEANEGGPDFAWVYLLYGEKSTIKNSKLIRIGEDESENNLFITFTPSKDLSRSNLTLNNITIDFDFDLNFRFKTKRIIYMAVMIPVATCAPCCLIALCISLCGLAIKKLKSKINANNNNNNKAVIGNHIITGHLTDIHNDKEEPNQFDIEADQHYDRGKTNIDQDAKAIQTSIEPGTLQ